MFAFARCATTIPDLIAGRDNLALLPDYERSEPGSIDEQNDGEMAVRTIFPFMLRSGGRWLSLAEAQRVYRALNTDVADLLPPAAAFGERQLAARLCHIGQPVAITGPNGERTAALRISAGARIVSENWTDSGEGAAIHNLQREFAQIRTVLDKIDLLLRHPTAVAPEVTKPVAAPPARASG